VTVRYQPPHGWRYPTIGEIAAPRKGAIRIGPFGSALKKSEYAEFGVRVLGIEDVYPNRLVSDRCKYIPERKFQQLAQYLVSGGDLLVTNMGTVGRTCVVPDDLERSIISSHLIKVTLDTTAAWPTYVSWMLNYSPLVVAQIREKSHGAIMAGFNSGLLKELRIPLPLLAEQHRIADMFDQIEALRAQHREAIGVLDALFDALQHRAFRGEL
jgi:type I restriction enzyme S subunit